IPAVSAARAPQQALGCMAFLMCLLQSGQNGKCLAVTEISGWRWTADRICISMFRQSGHWKSEKTTMRIGETSGPCRQRAGRNVVVAEGDAAETLGGADATLWVAGAELATDAVAGVGTGAGGMAGWLWLWIFSSNCRCESASSPCSFRAIRSFCCISAAPRT